MQFAQIEMFHGFWGIILLSLFLLWATRYRQRIINRFTQENLQPEIAQSYDSKMHTRKSLCLVLTCLFGVLALVRPQWGYHWQEVKRQGIDVVVAIDTSKSMLTTDVKPNRLERTKLAVKDLVKKLRGDRIGLLAFAGDAFLVCPLTSDYSGFLLSLDDLDTSAIPRGGTYLARAIEEAIKGYEDVPSKYKAIIILTDGENLEGDPVAAAQKARKKGIKIFCVGIGTKEGELIQLTNQDGSKEFLKDKSGNFVKSRLNEKFLQEIALATDGAYIRASGAQFGLDIIYDRELSKIEKRDIESKMGKKYHERFQIPLSIALVFLVMDSCLTTRRRKSK